MEHPELHKRKYSFPLCSDDYEPIYTVAKKKPPTARIRRLHRAVSTGYPAVALASMFVGNSCLTLAAGRAHKPLVSESQGSLLLTEQQRGTRLQPEGLAERRRAVKTGFKFCFSCSQGCLL